MQDYDLAVGKRNKAPRYGEQACATLLSTKTERKHFHCQNMGEGELLVTLRVKKKQGCEKYRFLFFFMKQIELNFESESYFAIVLLRNGE